MASSIGVLFSFHRDFLLKSSFFRPFLKIPPSRWYSVMKFLFLSVSVTKSSAWPFLSTPVSLNRVHLAVCFWRVYRWHFFVCQLFVHQLNFCCSSVKKKWTVYVYISGQELEYILAVTEWLKIIQYWWQHFNGEKTEKRDHLDWGRDCIQKCWN